MEVTAAYNSSHPLFGFFRPNEIFSLKIFFSTFDKIAVKNPAQSGGCNPLPATITDSP